MLINGIRMMKDSSRYGNGQGFFLRKVETDALYCKTLE